MKILLDTDIGCDIDDCLALPYLLAREDVELLGITTVTGKPHLRAQLAKAVCDASGREIPIHVGLEEPISGAVRQTGLTSTQSAVAEGCDTRYSEEETAIEFMRKTIEENPHEVTLLAIGPLTNVAALFSAYPHIPALLEGLAIMGGRYRDDPTFDTARWGKTEWNILCDTKAAEIVFSSCACPCLVIGVEETCRFSIPPKPLKDTLLGYPRWRPVSDAINTVVERIFFHDVILAYALFHPEEVTTERGEIAVNTAEGGATPFTPCKNGRFRIVTDYDPGRFFENYKKALDIEVAFN